MQFRLLDVFLCAALVQLFLQSTLAYPYRLHGRTLVTITTDRVDDDGSEYDSAYCQNTTHSDNNTVIGIKAYTCVNLYKGKGCQGRFVRWQPYLFESIEGEVVHEWDEDHDLSTSHPVVGSLGPCFEACDARHWDNLNLTETVNVTVYDDEDFKGTQGTLSVNGSNCVIIPVEVARVESVKIVGNSNSCIEFHSTYDCSDEMYTIFRPGYPMLNDLYYHGMHESARQAAYTVKAVSLCGKFCNPSDKPSPSSTSSRTETTALDDSKVFPGEREDLDITLVAGDYYTRKIGSFNVSSCLNIPSYLLQHLDRISSNTKKCVNFYADENCQGRVTRWQPYLKNLYNPRSHHWDGNILRKENFGIKSVGPCKDKCDPAYWEGSDATQNVEVTLFDNEEFVGNMTALTIKPGDCALVSRTFKSESIKIKGTGSCVELHSAPHCGDTNYAILRPGYPHLNDLWYHGMNEDSTLSVLQTRAVSLCGSFCEKREEMKEVNEPPAESQGAGIVTVFDYNGYYGNPIHFDLNQGCVNFKPNELNLMSSLWTYGQCVVIYGSKDCRKDSVFTGTLQTSGKPAEYYMEKLTAFTFPIFPKSMRLCVESESLENVKSIEPVNEPVPVVHVEKISESVSQEEPAGSYAYVYWMLVVGLLVYTALIATLGAVISSKYHAYSLKEDSRKFSVMYNSRNSEGTDRLL